MLKIDNNNNYDYNQILVKKPTGQRQYIIPKLKIWAWSLDQKSSYNI